MDDKDLDLELDKLMDTHGRYYTAFGADYAGEDLNNWQQLRERRKARFKEWFHIEYD